MDLTSHGIGNIQSVMQNLGKLGENQVSILDKNGWCRGGGSPWEKFKHPGWVSDKHSIENVNDAIELLKVYPENSIDVIYYGSHGTNGHAYIGGEDVIDSKEAKEIIASRLRPGGWFVLTGCRLGSHEDRMNKLSDEIKHPVVAATSNTDNDLQVSLWVPGKWRIFFGKDIIGFVYYNLLTLRIPCLLPSLQNLILCYS